MRTRKRLSILKCLLRRRIERCYTCTLLSPIFSPKLTHAAARFGCDSWPTWYGWACGAYWLSVCRCHLL